MSEQEMERYRRILVALALLVALLLFAGCDAPQTPAQPASVAPTTSLPTPEPTLEATATAAMPADAHPTSLVAPKLYTYRILDVYPHDATAFTQGLIVRDGQFLEGTGLEGQSTLRRVELESGKVLEQNSLDAQYFGEGITELNGKIYQLTWRNGTGFVYDAQTLKPEQQFTYNTEGWGITHDGEHLIVSDGTANLQFWDPATLQPVGGVVVSLFGLPLANIN